MHETIIANKIIEKAKKQGSVKSVKIEVGDLAHLPAEDLKKVLQEMTSWDIKIDCKKATVSCRCGYKGEPKILEKAHDMTIFECPKCHDIPKILDGSEIVLKEVKCA